MRGRGAEGAASKMSVDEGGGAHRPLSHIAARGRKHEPCIHLCACLRRPLSLLALTITQPLLHHKAPEGSNIQIFPQQAQSSRTRPSRDNLLASRTLRPPQYASRTERRVGALCRTPTSTGPLIGHARVVGPASRRLPCPTFVLIPSCLPHSFPSTKGGLTVFDRWEPLPRMLFGFAVVGAILCSRSLPSLLMDFSAARILIDRGGGRSRRCR